MFSLLCAAALQDNGHTQYRSRHKKTDLTSVVTALLVQLDNAITTTHQCLSKEALDKNDRCVFAEYVGREGGNVYVCCMCVSTVYLQ